MSASPSARSGEARKAQRFSGGTVFAGCSGWAYASWKPDFYPQKTPPKEFLEYYANRLNSVEVNYSFRQNPSHAMVEGWLAQTGPGFRFSFKAPQRITHLKRLKDCGEALADFHAAIAPAQSSGRMGLILFQLPPNFKADPDRLDAFLECASRPELRLAMEFRHPSWFQNETYRILRQRGAALCFAESDGLETPEIATAGFSCYRLRRSGYTAEALGDIERRIRDSAQRGDVFAYFKHEESPEGAFQAEEILRRITAP